MRVIICGGRDHPPFTAQERDWLHSLGITCVITGGARGVDQWAAQWAEGAGLPVIVVVAEWGTYGKGAGPIRNAQMLATLTTTAGEVAVVAFPGGAGTADMVRKAEKAAIRVIQQKGRV